MASASGNEEYEKMRKKVIEQRRSREEVSPGDMYRLAVLMARWATNHRLPICLLCRELDKQPKTLGHTIPHSVLKAAGRETFFDHFRGVEGGVSNCGYYAFCKGCEEVFQQGEVYFNSEFFKPFFANVDAKIEKNVTLNDSFPWLYYCLISIIWRSLCFVPANSNCIEVLEYCRSYLLNWRTLKIDERVKLFLFAPNHEIDRLLGGNQVYEHFFYHSFSFTILGSSYFPSDPKFLPFWLFCGPLHILMLYSEHNFSCMESNECFQEWEAKSLLTSKTKKITIEDKKSRIFPVVYYDQVIESGLYNMTYTTRLPSAAKNSNSESPILEGKFLHLLPKDTSYNRVNKSFDFSTDMFEKKDDRLFGEVRITKVARKGNNEKIVFVAFPSGLTNGGEVALGLRVKADYTVEYMKGVFLPKNTNLDLSKPPFKELIERILVHLQL